MISLADVKWARQFGGRRGERYGIGADEGESIALLALWEAALAWDPTKGKASLRNLAYSRIGWAILDERRRKTGTSSPVNRGNPVTFCEVSDSLPGGLVDPEARAELHFVAKAIDSLGPRKSTILRFCALEQPWSKGGDSAASRTRQRARKELKARLAA